MDEFALCYIDFLSVLMCCKHTRSLLLPRIKFQKKRTDEYVQDIFDGCDMDPFVFCKKLDVGRIPEIRRVIDKYLQNKDLNVGEQRNGMVEELTKKYPSIFDGVISKEETVKVCYELTSRKYGAFKFDISPASFMKMLIEAEEGPPKVNCYFNVKDLRGFFSFEDEKMDQKPIDLEFSKWLTEDHSGGDEDVEMDEVESNDATRIIQSLIEDYRKASSAEHKESLFTSVVSNVLKVEAMNNLKEKALEDETLEMKKSSKVIGALEQCCGLKCDSESVKNGVEQRLQKFKDINQGSKKAADKKKEISTSLKQHTFWLFEKVLADKRVKYYNEQSSSNQKKVNEQPEDMELEESHEVLCTSTQSETESKKSKLSGGKEIEVTVESTSTQSENIKARLRAKRKRKD